MARSPRTPTARPPRRSPRAAGTGAIPQRRSRARRGVSAGRMFVPSALTILAICCGLTAMRFASMDNIDMAMLLLVAAAVLDGLDGRVARLMDASTKMGAEVDSLADAINFGVVPAVIVYSTMLSGENLLREDIGWLIVLVYCSAIVLRLARFNTLLDDDSAPAYTKEYFVGVPAPIAALMALLPIGLEEQFGDGWWASEAAVCVWLVFVSFLAVSRIPTLSLKAAKVRPRALIVLLILVAAGGALLMTFPYLLLVLIIAAYLLHIPFAWRMQRWVASHPDYWDTAARDRRRYRRDERRSRRAAPTPRPSRPRKSSARLGLRRPEATPEPSPADPEPGDSPAPSGD